MNQLGFVSSYSPIRQNEGGTYVAAPEYYGMLAFAQGSQGALLAVDCAAAGANIAAYAVVGEKGGISVTIISRHLQKVRVRDHFAAELRLSQ